MGSVMFEGFRKNKEGLAPVNQYVGRERDAMQSRTSGGVDFVGVSDL